MIEGSKILILIRQTDGQQLNQFLSFSKLHSNLCEKERQHFLKLLVKNRSNPELFKDYRKTYCDIFNKKQFNEKQLRYILSDYVIAFEDFLCWRELGRNPIGKKILLSGVYQQNGINKYLDQQLLSAKKQLSLRAEKTDEYFEYNFRVNELTYLQHLGTNNRGIDDQLQQTIESLDYFYLYKKLKYCCEAINRKNILKVEYQLNYIDSIVNEIDYNKLSSQPVLQAYYNLILMLKEAERETYYRKLVTLLKDSGHLISKQETGDFYTFLQNYCIQRINKGNTGFLKELFENYKLMIGSGAIFQNQVLPQFHFKNIVTASLRVKEYDWAEKFVFNYKDFLPATVRENEMNYALGRIYYASGENKKAMRKISSMKFNDVYYQLDSKLLLAKIYFEQNDDDALFMLISSVRLLLYRNKKISGYQKLVYSNFLWFLERLAKIRNTFDKGKLDKLSNRLETEKQVADIGWIKEKIAQLS